MKRLLVIVAALLFVSTAAVFAASNSAKSAKNEAGLDPVMAFGWIQHNSQDQITVIRGVNFGLGFTAKHYFKPVKFDAFNPFWDWGTVALLVPYVGIGGDYVTSGGFYFTIGTMYVAPYLGAGFMF